MKILSEKELIHLKSLVYLLDDEDDSIYDAVRQQLIMVGEPALQVLETNLPNEDPLLKARVKEAYEVITSSLLLDQLRALCEKCKDDLDLEQGVMLIAKHGYPQVDMRNFSDLLTFFAVELQSRLDFADAPEEIALKIGRYFADEKGFSGRDVDYFNHDYHYINKVIETKRGVPISLSVVYILVLKRLNLPVRGIGMPGHFLVRYQLGGRSFIADPYHGGRILSLNDCRDYLAKMGYVYNSQYLEPVDNRQILERMLRNLVIVYEKKEQLSKVQTFLRCIDILKMNV